MTPSDVMALVKSPEMRCAYCRRDLKPPYRRKGFHDPKIAWTRDHVTPRALGGRESSWVPSCRACNGLKGDLPLEDWLCFINLHSSWWRKFHSNKEVRLALSLCKGFGQ